MIIFLYGPDTYRSREKLNAVIKRYKSIHQSGLSLMRFNRENFSFDKFHQRIKTISMFNEKKLIILEELLGTTKDLKFDLNKLKTNENIIIVLWENNPDKRNNLFRWLKNNAQCQEFKFLNPSELRRWIEKRCKEKKSKIKPDAKELLIFYVGPDLWRLSQEIEKLACFKNYTTIESRDVKILVSPQIDLNIFEAIDALAKGIKSRALKLIWEHLDNGSESSYLFSMILWQFRNLIKVSSSSKVNLHPFVIKKSTLLLRRFTKERLKNIYEYLLDTDLAIKTGKIDPKVALDLLVMEI